jgi:hypothetical protein
MTAALCASRRLEGSKNTKKEVSFVLSWLRAFAGAEGMTVESCIP